MRIPFRFSLRLCVVIALLPGAGHVWSAEPKVAEIVASIREAGLDPAECYRVRDLSFAKEDIRLYFNEGYLIFSRPVLGRRPWVVFSGDVEGGDAEIILIPPTRSERQSLAKFTQSPNLNEHLRDALIIATDGTVDELLAKVRAGELPQRAPEAAPLLVEKWGSVVANITQPMETRLVQDLLAPRTSAAGFMLLAVNGRTLGNFDVVLDARTFGRITVRQKNEKEQPQDYHVWTSFMSRSARMGGTKAPPDFSLSRYRIEAIIDRDVHLKATSRVTVKVGNSATRAFPMNIARAMRVTSVQIDGQPAELLFGDSPRGSIAPRGEVATFLSIAPEPLTPGSEHEFVFEHEGNVITAAGDGVFFVSARGGWYPHVFSGFATYDLTFRYPKRLTLVTAGEIAEDREDGDWRITRRRSLVPMGTAGFNLGDYEKTTLTAASVAVEVYGNRHLVDSLKPRIAYSSPLTIPAPSMPSERRGPNFPRESVAPVPVIRRAPDPLARLKAVAADMASALEFFSGLFGPPAMKTLSVAPIPGAFGQGFPGLVYLSLFAYLDPVDRPAALRNARERVFFSDLIAAHEAAHQWWGSVVTVDRIEDEWLQEALANYSALMWLEKKKGTKEIMKVLDGYRDELLMEEHGAGPRESAGPIVWGDRLRASGSMETWRTITYGKGTWVLHMLRKRMGDERFLSALAELRRKFEFRSVTTEDFRTLIQQFRPKGMSSEAIETFFENWIDSTGIPSLQLRSSTKGLPPSVKLAGTVQQSGVEEDFSIDVPVEIQFSRGSSQTIWVRTSSSAESFDMTLKQAPTRVLIPDGVLTRK